MADQLMEAIATAYIEKHPEFLKKFDKNKPDEAKPKDSNEENNDHGDSKPVDSNPKETNSEDSKPKDSEPEQPKQEVSKQEQLKQEDSKQKESAFKAMNIKFLAVEITGLIWTATEEEIRKFLTNCEIVKVLIVQNSFHHPKGNAVVWLASQDDLDKALLFDKKNFGKRYVYVRKLNDSLGTQEGFTSSNNEVFMVKLRGLPWTATRPQICNFLQGCAVVGGQAGVTIEMNERGKPSGTATVRLQSKTDFENALKYNKQNLGTRYVNVEKMKSQEVDAKKAEIEEEIKQAKEEEENPTLLTVKLTGIPWKATEQDISDFLFGCEIAGGLEGVSIVMEGGRPKGDALVQLKTKADFETALKYNKQGLGLRYVNITTNLDDEDEDEGKADQLTNDGWFYVKLMGFARKATDTEVSEFLTRGNVEQKKIVRPTDERGVVSGNAFIKVYSDADLKSALALNEKTMGNRKIDVFQVTMAEYQKAEKP
eukprot:GFUD01002158.1.p1 GENE.GFUD01002158.1~~GFUD01002158.1.p1  ORF type:complete len:537 (+),score=162.80 GFUD01002158.1:167-1612(+)